jgi:hypothetical protein
MSGFEPRVQESGRATSHPTLFTVLQPPIYPYIYMRVEVYWVYVLIHMHWVYITGFFLFFRQTVKMDIYSLIGIVLMSIGEFILISVNQNIKYTVKYIEIP